MWKEAFTDDRDFRGQMDEVRVWAGERSQEQIRATMNARVSGGESNLVALWNFDDPGEPGRDATPGRHDGKLMGDAKVIRANSAESCR